MLVNKECESLNIHSKKIKGEFCRSITSQSARILALTFWPKPNRYGQEATKFGPKAKAKD